MILIRFQTIAILLGLMVLTFTNAGCAKASAMTIAGQAAQTSSAAVATIVPGAAPAMTAETTLVATNTAAAPARPWYADTMEKLGFYVFPSPVDVGDFTVEALKGGNAKLSQSKGKIVLLNFWATWCPPCRAEMPSIEALSKAMRGKAFSIIAVSVSEEKPTVEKFIAEQKYSYPIFLDRSGQLGTAFNASSIPTTYIVDKAGKVIAGMQGSREYDGPEVIALFNELASR
jgi:thiol-disulfide isomerase/thioredoxin